VDAVIAWTYPVLDGGYGRMGAGEDDFQEAAAKSVTAAVSGALDPAGDVRVRTQVTQGIAAQVLLHACDGADLLVVGSRGHGGFAEALLGSAWSASTACSTHPAPSS
jgi:nucleotide-binding universal stress UspA family protein